MDDQPETSKHLDPQALTARIAELERMLAECRDELQTQMRQESRPRGLLDATQEHFAEGLYRTLVENVDLGITLIDKDHKIVMINGAQGRLCGEPPETFVGDKCYWRFQRRQSVCPSCPGARAMQTGVAAEEDEWGQREDGGRYLVRIKAFPVPGSDGRPIGFIEVAEDITDQHHAEAALRRSEQRFHLLTQNIKDVIWSSDLNFRCDYISPAHELLTGFTAEEAMRMPIEEIATSQSVAEARRILAERLRIVRSDPQVALQPYTLEAEFNRKGGGTVWAEVNASLLLSDEGQPVGLMGITRDITARKAVQIELARAKELAEAANRAKSGFLANMSHEIRTPMTAILGYVDILMDNATRPEDIEAASTIKRNGEYLLRIINDILDLSKIEAGRMQVERLACSPLEIVTDVIALVKIRAEAKNLPLRVFYESLLPAMIHTDPMRLRQILINLLSNAIKFTEVGSVELRVHLLDPTGPHPRLQFSVVDTGIGIDEVQLDGLFRPFAQANSSTNRCFGGTGLGLVISKRLANMLGGDIGVKSRLGRGSIFTVDIETGPLGGVPMFEAHEHIAIADEKPVPPPAPPTRLEGRVLLAEDGPDNQRLISFLLRKVGVEVLVAENGQVALDRVLVAKPDSPGYGGASPASFDLILMDMQMPLMDGYEATRQLRQAGYRGPIVALTAHAMKEDRQRCLEAGCDDYLAKPVDRASLIATVARYVRPSPPIPSQPTQETG
jgi:PAS domain S-box-containing protein